MNQRYKIAQWVLLLLFLSGNCHADLEQAAEAVQARDFDGAMQYLEAIPQGQREDPQWQLLRAASEAGSGKLKEAEQRYQALIQQLPQMPEAYNNLAALYARQGRLDEAMELLERAMKTNESYATVYANLRSIYYEMSRSAYARALQMEQQKEGPTLRPLLQVASALQAEPTVAAPPTLVALTDSAAEAVAQVEAVPEEAPPVAPPEAVNVALVEVEGVVPQALSVPQAVDTRRDDLVALLNRWAADWAGQKVEAYLAAYADDFRPGQGLSHQQWLAQRRTRLARPESIEVQLADFEVQFNGDTHASVTAIQYYRSERYSDTVRKRFQLLRGADGWKIVSEKTIEVL